MADWVSVARVASLAEVGYFEDVLSRENIETVVHERDDFDAVAGQWNQAFVVQVSSEQADDALRVLQSELNTTATDGDGTDDADDMGWASLRGSLWFVFLASGLAYFGMRALVHLVPVEAPAAPAAEVKERQGLWRALTESEEPWTSSGADGQALRRLQFDARRDWISLDEDTDGDGSVDRRRIYQDGALVGDEKR